MSTDPSTTDLAPTIPPGSSKVLASVLRQLGHECPGICPGSDPRLGDVRFAWRNSQRESSFLVVDLDPQMAAIPAQRLLQRINECTRRDQIRVLVRQPTDRSHALAALSPPWTVLA